MLIVCLENGPNRFVHVFYQKERVKRCWRSLTCRVHTVEVFHSYRRLWDAPGWTMDSTTRLLHKKTNSWTLPLIATFKRLWVNRCEEERCSGMHAAILYYKHICTSFLVRYLKRTKNTATFVENLKKFQIRPSPIDIKQIRYTQLYGKQRISVCNWNCSGKLDLFSILVENVQKWFLIL